MINKKILIIIFLFFQIIILSKSTNDLRELDFSIGKIYKLKENWKFYRKEFLNPFEIDYNKGTDVKIPHSFDKKEFGKGLFSYGYGTYHSVILIPEDEKKIVLKLNNIESAYKLFINGKMVGERGKVANNEKEMIPFVDYGRYFIDNNTGVLDIVLHVSNFNQISGGFTNAIEIYTFKTFLKNDIEMNNIDLFLLGSLLIMGIYHLGLFVLRRIDRSTLFFSFYCFIMGLRIIVMSEYNLWEKFGIIEWETRMKTEYFSFYFGVTLFATYVYLVFKNDCKKIILYFVQFVGISFSLITLLFSVQIVTLIKLYYQIFTLIVCIYFVSVMVLAKIRKRDGSTSTLIGFVILVATVVNDILYSLKIVYTGNFVPFGVLIYILSQSFMLSKRFSRAFKESERLSIDLEKKNIELEKLNKLKDEFLANTSHELRTPLNGIIGISQSLFEGIGGELSVVVKKNLKLIILSGKRLLSLINDILDFEKLKNKDISLRRESVDVFNKVEIVISLLRSIIKTKCLVVENKIEKNCFVLGDPDRIEQVLNNLIGNAIKFTKKGTIKIYNEKIHNKMHIVIKDTGIGIPEDRINKIFETFEQADGSTERIYGGTGLGLSISKNLINLQGGEIFVKSVLGEGSEFSFSLEISSNIEENVKKEVVSVFDEDQYKELNYSNVVTKEAKIKAKILIVDDEDINRKVLENLLKLKYSDLILAKNGIEALELLKRINFDLVILDIMMPEISGYDVCRKIREEYTSFELPVIFLTAKIRTDDIEKGFDSGANDYLTKPIEKNELFARVETLITSKNAVKNTLLKTKEFEKEKQEREISEKIMNFTKKISAAFEIEEVFEKLVIEVNDLIDFKSCYIVLRNEKCYSTSKYNGKEIMKNINLDFEFDHDFIMSIKEKDMIFVNSFVVKKIKFKKCLIIPVIHKDVMMGIFMLELNKNQLLEESKKNFIYSIISQAGFAIENINLFNRIIESSKKSTMTDLLKAIVHELKTPLTVINGYLKMIKKKLHKELKNENFLSLKDNITNKINKINFQTQRIDELSKDFLEYASINVEEVKKVKVDFRKVYLEIEKRFIDEITKNDISIEYNSENISFSFEENRFEKVLCHIIKNGIEAFDVEKNERKISIMTFEEKDEMIVTIEDNGVGIPDKILNDIYKPLVSSKTQGTGFGLPIIKGILEKNEGKIEIESNLGKGTKIVLKLKKV